MISRPRLAMLILAWGLIAPLFAQSPVQVESVSSQPIVQRVSASGTVTSPRAALLSGAVAGLVAEVGADEGQRVQAGEVLLSLDAELADLGLERARAELRLRQTSLADARRRFAEAEQVGPQQGIAQTRIESLRAEVSEQEALVAVARIAVREQAALVERHRVKAPFTGVVSRRFADPGEWVSPGDGLLELVATEDLRFDFQLAQEFFASVSMNTEVEITLDALPEKKLPARISAIVPVKNSGARTFMVRVLADTAGPADSLAISPGMSASASFSLATGRSGIAVSRDAVLRYPDGRVTVWVVESRDGKPAVREQPVRTGLEFRGLVEVTDGLNSGDVVVIRGNESLQAGQSVKILDGTP